MKWSFFYKSFVKSHCKKYESHMTVLYLNPCYNEVCYKGTALYPKVSMIQGELRVGA